jgi:glutamine synthetase
MIKARKAEYIWLDGSEGMPRLRSKTKVIGGVHAPVWGFDGSSTNQATGDQSDCVLSPVFTCPDPTRATGTSLLVLCEVLLPSGEPHETNTRSQCASVCEEFKESQPLFGIEQEYTLFKEGRPLGWAPVGGDPPPQGNYYCGVGADVAFGRTIVEEHMDACLRAGLSFEGINAEVMPGQWEFQIGAIDPVAVSDELWVARWLLNRIAENHGVLVSYDPKPVPGDWNGAGCHTNFSTTRMRQSCEACFEAAEILGNHVKEHLAGYGEGIERRLTGEHETCSYKEFRWGVSDRGASIRIPWHVAKNDGGYIEDRRPNANCDPYVVTRLITNTVCTNVNE